MQQGFTSTRACPRNAYSYAWQRGDTVATVTAMQGITAADLAAANPDINFDTIRPGILICVPIGPQNGISTGDNNGLPGGPVLDGTANDNNTVTPELPGGPVLDGTANDNNTVTPNLPGGPVLDGTANDNNTVTPQRPGGTVVVPVVPVRPVLSCPIGYEPYTVQRGQTYADLLVNLNVSYNALRGSNPALNPARLVAGTRFCAPPAGTRQLCAANRRTYRIQENETLAMVAEKFNTTQGRLLLLNPSMLPTDFTTGAVICVPAN